MLTARPINSDALLNNFEEIESQDFVTGETSALAWQLWNDELDLRYILPAAAVVTLTFNNVDGTTFNKSASFVDAGDRSLLKVALSATETTDLMSGNVSFSIDVLGDQTVIKKGVIYNALRRCDLTAG